MYTSTASSNQIFKNGLNIHLLSFSLPKEIIKDKEEIRVSITTMPDEFKQHFTIKGKLMDHTNHLFSLNITNQTQKIIMVFRKKTLLSDNPIIASTVIYLNKFKELPKEQINSGVIETDVQGINLYYPLQKQMKEEHTKNIQRIILGQMKIKLSFTTPFTIIQQDEVKTNSKTNQKNKSNNKLSSSKENKKQKMKKNKKVSDYKELDDDEFICDSLLN